MLDLTISKLIPPEAMEKWDRYDYKVISPSSIEDGLLVTVVLKNGDGSSVFVQFPLATKPSRMELVSKRGKRKLIPWEI